jgi:hypothetical protein
MREIETLYVAIDKHVVRQCSQLIMRQVYDAQLFQGPQSFCWDVHDVVPREKQYLQVLRIFKAVKIHLRQIIVSQVEPLQVWHVAEDTLSNVPQLIV